MPRRRSPTSTPRACWPGKVVTEVAPAGPFWEAEPEHQDYLEHYPNGYTCHFVRPNWVLPRESRCRLERAGGRHVPLVTCELHDDLRDERDRQERDDDRG